MSGADARATLAHAAADWARAHGTRPALVGTHRVVTFAELDEAAERWAAVVANAAAPGAHVGLLAPNTPDWLAAAFGVWRAGATLVPISTFATAREVGEIIAHADLSTIIAPPRIHTHDVTGMLARLPPAQRPARIIALDQPPIAAPARGAVVDPESIAAILYTSGTTGRPKGVMLSHRAILATVGPTRDRMGLGPEDSLLSTLPLFWVAGLVIRALPTLAAGCALILLERFTADAAVEILRRHRPTALHLRPPQVGQVLAHPDFVPALLASVRRGGGRTEWFQPHLDPEHARLITGYGMTETAGYVTALDWRDPADVRASQIGRPLPGVELRIVTNDERACAPDAEGEIRVRCPGLFSGYYKHPAGTGLDVDGFFRTGDLGRIDAEGRFHFAGRTKDLLRVKGINVSPVEVEQVLASHPAVDAVYVVGVPAAALDQTVAALIVTRGGVALPEPELRALASDALSHYKRPQHYLQLQREEVPLSGTSKPVRAALAALAAGRIG
jgi:fatty-acyl-CoA synthase